MHLRCENRQINQSDDNIFLFVSDCSNFGKYLPPDMTQYETTADYCKFSMKNIAEFNIEIIEKKPNQLVVFRASNDKKIPISMSIHIEKSGDLSNLWIELQAEIPFFLQGMVKSPLQKFIDVLADKIKMESEKL